MRLILAVPIGLGLLALTACSKTQQPPVASSASSPGESASHATLGGDSSEGDHNPSGNHAGHGHEFGDDQHAFAEEALQAVLTGAEVHVKKTKHKG